MSSNRKAPDLAKRKKKLMRLSGLTESLIAPALAKKSAYLTQLIAHWPQIAGPYASWAKPTDLYPPNGADHDGTLILSIHSGRGPEASLEAPHIIERVNRYMGFQLITQMRFKQDLPLQRTSDTATHQTPTKASSPAPLTTQQSSSLQEALDRLGAAIEAKAKK